MLTSRPQLELKHYYRIVGTFSELQSLKKIYSDLAMKLTRVSGGKAFLHLFIYLLGSFGASFFLNSAYPNFSNVYLAYLMSITWVTLVYAGFTSGIYFLGFFAIINPGIFLVIGMKELLSKGESPLHWSLLGWVFLFLLLSFVTFFLSRLFHIIIRRKIAPQIEEVDYVFSLIEALKVDLSQKQLVDLTLNPYPVEYSATRFTPDFRRTGYTYKGYDDLVFNLKIEMRDQWMLGLKVLDRSIVKTKNRKSKYKGTKHRLFYIFEAKTLKTGSSKEGDAIFLGSIKKNIEEILADRNAKIKTVYRKQSIRVLIVRKAATLEAPHTFHKQVHIQRDQLLKIMRILLLNF